jgi:hypothetical protein
MVNKEIDVLTSLVNIYKNVYTHKELLNLNLKYSQNEIEDFYQQMRTSIETKNAKKSDGKKEVISEDVLALKTPDDVKEYFMKYQSGSDRSNNSLIEKLSLTEFDYIYNIIYSSPLKSGKRKIDALNSIEKYFNGIARAISMKP